MSRLFLIPSPIADETFETIPAINAKTISHVKIFFVEEPKSARRFLKKINPDINLNECQFFALNEHTSVEEISRYQNFVVKEDCGIISEAGCPCVADPGAVLARLAHAKNIQVVPLVGPSSIMLALMASGLNGQTFSFHGYLPKDQKERREKIRSLEKKLSQEKATQIFMETPYRNNHLLEDILLSCHPKTTLCIASDLTSKTQTVKTQSIEDWRKEKISLRQSPTLFLLG